MTAREFLLKSCEVGGRIVSSGELHRCQIAEAQAKGLFFVDEDTKLGWAILPWALTTDKDRERESLYFAKKLQRWKADQHSETQAAIEHG